MAFDPTKPFTVVQQAPAFDPSQPFKKVEDEPHTQGYLADKGRRLGRGIPEVIGQTVAGVGSGFESAAQLAEDALLATAVKRGDMTEEDAAKVRQHFAEKKAQDPLFQGAQAVRDVGAQLTAVGPKWIGEPDRTRDDEIGSAVISGATSLVPLLATARINPGLAIPSYAAQMGESQRAEAAAAGANPSGQAQAYGLAAGLGAGSEALLGVPALFRSIQGAKIVPELLAQGEKLIDSAVSKALSKQILARSAGQVVKGGIREGLQEGVEQVGGNVIAKDLVGYDPERDRTQGVGMAMLAGGIVGGGVGGVEQYRNDRAQLKGHEAYKAQLDTDKNVPEATKTLLLQRDQLQRGLRPAQMFPKGTPELPVPQGMERVETERGIFHFNPQQTSADDIVALSKAGRENEILNLGPFSKPEIEAQAKKTGEPILTVNERAPDGTEVKSSVATPSTAGAQAQVVDATKTPGNTVDVTTPGQTILERLRAQQEAQDQARREADAKEEAARTTRRAELDAKKARFDQEMNAARTLAADPAADYTKVKAGVTTLTQYVQDNSLGLTQDQRNEALAELARLTPRLESLEPAYQAQRDASEQKTRQQDELARQARIEKIRAENARIDAIEATGRDPDTGRIVEIEKVPDEELNTLDLQAEGIDENAYGQELQRREREAANENVAGYNLRDLFIGRKDKLRTAGLKTPLRLPTPEVERARGGQGGELAVLQEGGVPWQYFAKEAKGLDTLAETLRGLGFQAETESDAIALVQRAFAGEDVRPTGGEMQFATQADQTTDQKISTPEFRRWFGKSQVVDQRGKPIIAYHGTPNANFSSFKRITEQPDSPERYFGDEAIDATPANIGFWFVTKSSEAPLTEALTLAENFAGKRTNLENTEHAYPAGAGIVPSFLSIKNPKRYSRWDELREEIRETGSATALRKKLKNDGYDGILIRNSQTDGGWMRDDWVAFEPTQIKSATGNRGTFDPNDPNINFAQDATDPRQMSLKDLTPVDRATAEWSAAFDEAMEDYYQNARDSVDTNPPQRVSAEDQARRDGEVLPPAAARQRVEQWKAAARAQGKNSNNADKIILSLFDSTGVWSQPWRDAGYTVVQIDQNIVGGDGYEMDVMEIDQEWLMDNGLDMVHGVLAACPCTEFAGSGARWFKIKDANGRTAKARQLVNHTLAIIEYLQPDGFWAIENPVGRIKQETAIPNEQLQFQPHNYGDPYTKRTQIFGMFNPNLPLANVAPTKGSYSWNLSGTSAKAKAERSKTFEGFAYAFFMANQDRDARVEAEATADQKTGPQFGQRKAPAANRVSTKQPGQLTDAEVSKQLQALRSALGPIAEEFDIQVGLIADLLEKEGYTSAAQKVRSGDYGVLNAVTAPRLKAQLDEIRHQPRFIVVASLSAQAGKMTGLTLHELAHPFYDALPEETKDVLRQMHAQETSSRTGPLFENGKIQTDVAIFESDLPAERIAADPDLPVKEWFSERIRKLNEGWLDGKVALAESPTIVRLWRQFMDSLRKIFAQVWNQEANSDLFTDAFRAWIATSTKMDLAKPAAAYAAAKRAEFAQGLLQLDSPIGLGLPIEIRNLTPNWQDKSLRFESNLDKALFYAGVTGYTGTRDKLIRHLSEQTGLSTGQIGALARELRLKLRALTRSAATGSTISVPPQMREAAAELTGVEFAQQAEIVLDDVNLPATASEEQREIALFAKRFNRLHERIRQDRDPILLEVYIRASQRLQASLEDRIAGMDEAEIVEIVNAAGPDTAGAALILRATQQTRGWNAIAAAYERGVIFGGTAGEIVNDRSRLTDYGALDQIQESEPTTTKEGEGRIMRGWRKTEGRQDISDFEIRGATRNELKIALWDEQVEIAHRTESGRVNRRTVNGRELVADAMKAKQDKFVGDLTEQAARTIMRKTGLTPEAFWRAAKEGDVEVTNQLAQVPSRRRQQYARSGRYTGPLPVTGARPTTRLPREYTSQGTLEFSQQANLLPKDQAGHANANRDFKREDLPAGDNPPSKGDLDDLKLYAFPGNKSEINSKIYGLIQRAVQAADHVADLTFGAGVHYQTARRADRAGQVKEWTVNEWSPLRVSVVRQMGQAPEAVLDQAAKFYAEILTATKAARAALGKKAKGNQAQRAESRAVQAWMNRTVWEHVLPAGFDIDAWVEANGDEANLPVQDTPAAAAWALVAQEYKGGLDSVELTVRPVDATQEMELGDSKRENYRPRGGQRFRLGDILTQISYPTASRSNADGSGINREARERLLKIAAGYQGATVTQGDAWDKLVPLAQAAKDKGQRLLVFLDPPYWKNTDLKGGSSNYSAAVSAGASLSGLRKRVDILKKAHDLGARVLFTNDWHPLLANDLRKAGYYVISEDRANDATKPEVIAFNWNPQNGNQETRPEAHAIHLSDGGTRRQLEPSLQDPADKAGDPDNRGGRPAAESDTARPGEEDRADLRTQQPAQRVAEIDARLAELNNGTDQDEAAIEEEGKRLADERTQLVREINEAEQRALADAQLKTAAELEQSASEAAKLSKHPAAKGNVLPGEAWATVPAMTPNQIQKEIEAIGEYFSDNIDSLSGAEKGNLNARLDALKAELKRREDPIAAAPRVQAIVPTTREQRRDALLAELQRGRKMRDDGIKANNDEAEREGLRIVRRATEALNDEFPGWEQQNVPNQTKGQIENASASQPEPATRAQRAEDDGRNLPPAPPAEPPENGQPMEDPPPPDRGRVGDLFGHSSHVPTWLERSWTKIREAMVGIRGSVPELPTFPNASWNKKDRFIAREGAEFYNRLQEFWRVLRSGNDYIQRTAEEAVSNVVAPLLRLGGDFDAAGYKKLQRLQEKARVLRSTNKPVPARMAATIQALTSRMESHPYVLFNRFVVLMDLDWRMKNLKDSKGNPIRLPLGLNSTELETEIQRINRLIAGHRHAQAINTAIEQHLALVKQVSDDLVRRDLFAAEHLRNPYYFPHLTLEITQGDEVKQRVLQPERVRPGTEADFRGYLIDPVGSTKPIETDYVRAMYYHMVQVGAHNFKADAIRDHARSYDVMKQVQDRALELSKQRGQAVSWEQVFNEEYAPQGYVLYGTDSRDAFPTLQIDRDKLAFRLGEELTSEDLQDQLRAMGAKGIRLQPEDIRQTLIQGQRETWIVPARVAEALRGIARRQEALEHDRGNPWTAAMGMWKAWKLFTPHNHIRYEFNNVVADLEKIWSATPGTFLQLPKAAKEIREFYLGGKPGDALRAAMKDGVINAITAQEMGQLQKMRAFEKFQTMAERLRRQALARGSSLVLQPITALTGLGDLTSVEISAFRESTVRYANYLANLEAIRNGARPAYAGAYWRDIEAIQDSAPGAGDRAQRQAAQISKATFGDYGDLTVNGEWLRKNLVPFYSWMEVNFKYHANLLRNLRDMARAGETTNAQAAGQAAKALAGFGARAGAGVVLRLALPYAAVALWNTIGGPMAGAWDDDDDLESELSEEDRRRFHIILGRTPDGKVNVIYGATALADVMKWFSGPAFVQHMSNWLKGRTDFLTAATGWRDEIAPNLVNIAAGSLGPAVKIGVALTLRKNTFPDITDARTIPAYDLWRNVVAQTTDDFTADQLWRLVGKDYVQAKDLGTWTKQLILQIRQRDPEAWAFYAIKDKAAEFEYQQTGRRDGFAERDAPDQQVLRNFRRAVYQADLETATRMYLRLLDLGYTAERFQGSIRAQDPLSTLSKTDGLRQRFVQSLDATDQQLLRRAFAYYGRMASVRGAEQNLFPRKEWGTAGQRAYQAQPRTELLRQIIAIQGQGVSQQRINAEMWRSLQVR